MSADLDHPSRTTGDASSVSRPLESGGLQTPQATFEPLSTLPSDAPPSYRRRWERLAGQAENSYRAAVELKCLECCAWDRTEAKRCELAGCPLWARSRRIFGQREPAS